MTFLVLDAGALIARAPRWSTAGVARHPPSARRDPVGAGHGHADRSLTDEVAYALGLLLGASGGRDVVDAHVAHMARRLRATVVTSDPTDLAALDPELRIVTV